MRLRSALNVSVGLPLSGHRRQPARETDACPPSQIRLLRLAPLYFWLNCRDLVELPQRVLRSDQLTALVTAETPITSEFRLRCRRIIGRAYAFFYRPCRGRKVPPTVV